MLIVRSRKPRIIQHLMLQSSYSALGLIALCITGCGGTYNASVTGVVKLNNAALRRGIVTFTPESKGPSAYAAIGDDGSYAVKTGVEKGLPAGKYVVTVASNEQSAPSSDPALPPKPGKPITPAWYRTPQDSPLKFQVDPGRNTINLDLTLQPPPGWKQSAGRK
jgi:hypothetical protein